MVLSGVIGDAITGLDALVSHALRANRLLMTERGAPRLLRDAPWLLTYALYVFGPRDYAAAGGRLRRRWPLRSGMLPEGADERDVESYKAVAEIVQEVDRERLWGR